MILRDHSPPSPTQFMSSLADRPRRSTRLHPEANTVPEPAAATNTSRRNPPRRPATRASIQVAVDLQPSQFTEETPALSTSAFAIPVNVETPALPTITDDIPQFFVGIAPDLQGRVIIGSAPSATEAEIQVPTVDSKSPAYPNS